MKFDIITIFPELFNGFSSQSLIARAIKKKLIFIKAHNLRKWTTDRHQTVDGKPYGGGPGLVFKVEPIYKAVKAISYKLKAIGQTNSKKLKAYNLQPKTRVILLSAKGRQFAQRDARRLAKYNQLIFICGRYEGVDERVADYVADEEISVGPYVLFGGEIPAMVMIESISRLIPGVLGKAESLKEESFSKGLRSTVYSLRSNLEYPQYTRPESFSPKSITSVKSIKSKTWKVPPVLLSGDHKKIEEWRRRNTE